MSDPHVPANVVQPPTEEMETVRKQVRLFLKVGFISVLFTCATVAISFLTRGNVISAMLLATANAVMIAYFTMHLKWERGTIYRAVFLSLLMMAILFFLTYLHFSNPIHL